MKKRIAITALLMLATSLLVRPCDAQCICLPCLPIPAPWWCCQPCRTCTNSTAKQPQAEPAAKTCPCVDPSGNAACQTNPPADGLEEAPPLPVMDLEFPPEGLDEQVAVCFNKINELRGKSGQSLLKWDAHLGELAQSHSNNMAARHAMYHSWYGLTENVALGFVSGEKTFEQWLRSAPHLRNMMSGNRVGIARCGCFWTLIISR